MTLTEWQNLLAELKRPIERYGVAEVQEALDYIKVQQGIVTKPLNSGGLVVRQCKACYATYNVRDGHACPELHVFIPEV